MYKIRRYNVMHDLELLLIDGHNRATMERIVNEVYRSSLEIIVKSLNDNEVDPNTQEQTRLIDRIDKQFRECEVHSYIRMRCFEYVNSMAEDIRVYFLQLGCPSFVKYQLEIVSGYYQSAIDSIKIDFDTTARHMVESGMLAPKTEVRPSETVEMNPSLETLNAYYDTFNK